MTELPLSNRFGKVVEFRGAIVQGLSGILSSDVLCSARPGTDAESRVMMSQGRVGNGAR
jgi:hypothetical protein